MPRRLVAVVGPTASGKSETALELAGRVGGEIVNGDSRQIYRGMDIGTATPSSEERGRIRHHLYDICDPDETYSLALYLKDARAAMEDIWSRGSFPWLVGGTGQYIWSLLENWQVPAVPPNESLRKELTEMAERHGPDTLHARLAGVDPVAAGRIDARNVRRVVRAIEVFEATGTPISTWQTKSEPDFEFMVLGVAMDREELHRRIEGRTNAMFDAGFVAEVQALLDAGVPPDASAMSSIGYREVLKYLSGEIDLAEARDLTARATRRFVKRQLQWFRPGDERVRWIRSADEAVAGVVAFAGG